MDDDAERLRTFAAQAEERLAHLPDPAKRDVRQRADVERIHESCRRMRHRFMMCHAEAVYDRITAGRTRSLRLAELVDAAADRFPGLVPTPDQMRRERALRQADKEGREIDQGVFLRALLLSPSAGPHLLDAMMQPTPRALTLQQRFEREGAVTLPTVMLQRCGQAAFLTLQNTNCLNAEDEQYVDDLETAVDLALFDDVTRVGVVRGGMMTHPRYAGRRVFSAGINLRELQAGRISLTGFLLKREMGVITKIVHGLLVNPVSDAYPHRTRQKPWVAAVDAFAIGGGMQILLTVDRVIAADDAYFSLPAAHEGIVPGLANLRLSRFTGCLGARQMILGGRRINATDPDASLIIDEVVPARELDERIQAAVSDLAAPAVAANRRMLNVALEPVDRLLDYLAEFAYVQATRLYAPDVTAKKELPSDRRRAAADADQK